MKRCIDKYPTLSSIVRNSHTDEAFFECVSTIDLNEHILFAEALHSELPASQTEEADDIKNFEKLLPSVADQRWEAARPPWKLVVLPLAPLDFQGQNLGRCFVSFAFSHALGDAISAVAFLRTLGDGMYDHFNEDNSTVSTPTDGLPAPFDTPENLPITWGFLLRPLVAVLLPKFIAEMLGLRATASTVTPDTWIGTRMFFEPEKFHTCVKLVEIQGSKVEALLRIGRQNGAKLTAMIHQSLVRGLSKEIPRNKASNFVSGTAVNMRRAIGKSNDDVGLFVNAWYNSHHREDEWSAFWSENTWENARLLTQKLAECAITLEDQAVGLLRYAPSIRKWTAAKMGQERDSSYEISNLGSFDVAGGHDQTDGAKCRIAKLVFAHSANATSSPFTLSVVSVKGGNMVISFVWQPGALGLALGLEQEFIERLSTFVKEDLEKLV